MKTNNLLFKNLVVFYQFNLLSVVILFPIYYFLVKSYQFNYALISLIILLILAFINFKINYSKFIENFKKFILEQNPVASQALLNFAGFVFLSPLSSFIIFYQLLFQNDQSKILLWIFKNFKTSLLIVLLMAILPPFFFNDSQLVSTPSISYIGNAYLEITNIFTKEKLHKKNHDQLFIERFSTLNTIELPLVTAISLAEISKQKETNSNQINKTESQLLYLQKIQELTNQCFKKLNSKPYFLKINPLMLIAPNSVIESTIISIVDLFIQAKIEITFIEKINVTIKKINQSFENQPLSNEEMTKLKSQIESKVDKTIEIQKREKLLAYKNSILY